MRLSLVILLLLLLFLVGCSTILYPIEQQDIHRISKGTSIGNLTTDRDGYFISDLYLELVGKAKVKKK